MAHMPMDKDAIKGSVTPVYAALNIVIGDKRETIFYNDEYEILGRSMLNDTQLSYLNNFIKRVSLLTVYNKTNGKMGN